VAGTIAFDKATREALSRALLRRLKDDFGIDLDPMDGQQLVDTLSETFCAYWYNQGLQDAEEIMRRRVDDLAEAIAGLERPTPR
jgi:uncharacterized protein (DUF2164 family)